jgi:hypothetical protein
MKRKAGAMVLLAALGGWGSPAAQAGGFMSQYFNNTPDGVRTGAYTKEEAPNLVGPWGQPVTVTAPANYNTEMTGADYARATLTKSFPQDLVYQAFGNGPGGFQLTGGVSPPGPGGPAIPNGPSPCCTLNNPPGAVAAVGSLSGAAPAPFGVFRTEVRFVGPAGMKIAWYAPQPNGKVGFTPQYLEAPARYNFLQASIYRLKLSDIPHRPGVELYPTLEVVPSNVKTATFLAHSAVPVSFTEEDLEQVAAGNFVVKVIYLPDPAFQDLAATGPDEVVSTRLEPGVDPVLEAKRRGCILAIVRLGNIDLEAPNTPGMDAPPPGSPKPPFPPGGPMGPGGMPLPPGAMGMMPPGMPQGMMPPGMMPPGMLPPGMMPPGMMAPGMTPPAAPGASTPVKTPAPGTPVSKSSSGSSLLPTSFPWSR